ncbi:MAG: hypothetical protein QM503_06150 [Bacteroidota bacterium]
MNKTFIISYSIVVFAILIVTITSCSVKGYKVVSDASKSYINNIHIFQDNFNKALYKTNITIYGNELTGITIIKKTNNTMRVVSMSEMGMKYFDIEFPLDKNVNPIIHYIMEPLNRKLLINMFIRDFSLLFFPPINHKSKVMFGKSDSSLVLIKNKKIIYLFSSNGVVTDIKKQHFLLPTKTIATLSNYTQQYPGTIYFDHGKISLNFVNIKD